MKFEDFKRSLDKSYFTSMDMRLRHLDVYPYQLSLWKKSGLLESFKRGIYYFPEKKRFLTTESVAFALYAPSYISLESALSVYGFIPETVYACTSVTPRTTRRFSNAFGSFIYRSIHRDLFFGYEARETPAGKYLIAEPEKALLDYFYFNSSRIEDPDDIRELRVNAEAVREKLNKSKLKRYSKRFGSKKMDRIIDMFLHDIC